MTPREKTGSEGVRPFTVAVAAQAIPQRGAGLGNFLVNAVRTMAESKPEWRFRVVACRAFADSWPRASNVEVLAWDDTQLQRLVRRLLRKVVPERFWSTVMLMLSRYVPTDRLKAGLGDLRAIWNRMDEVDAVWVPHFSLLAWPAPRPVSQDLAGVRAPVLLTIHDIHASFYPDDWGPDSLRRFNEEFVPFARSCARVVTHTRWQRDAIIERLVLDAGKISVTPVPPLIEPAELECPGEGPDPELPAGFGVRRPYAFYPGSGTISHKNHTRLILAWSRLELELGESCPMLVCTARGRQLWPALHSLVGALGLEGRVVFTGTVGEAELGRLYRDCLLVIVPTLYEGGGSGPVAEAMMTGRPVLTSDIPQIREQLEAYGCEAPAFDAASVESIARAVKGALSSIGELEEQAGENRETLVPRVGGMWREWARFNMDLLEEIAK